MIFRSLFQNESDLQNPKDWLINLLGGSTTYSGERVTSDTALLNSNVYTCASILGGDIGKLPIQIFKRKGDRIERERSHPVVNLLGIRPNPYMSAYTFKELLQVHLMLWGNAYALIDWGSDGRPQALWPLNPTLTEVTTDPKTGEVWYVTTLPSGEHRKIPWFDLLHLKAISKTGLKGISPISVIREKLGIQQASDKFIGAFYANGTTSRGILKVPDILQPEAKDRTREEWQKLNSGLNNSHKVAILDGGLDYQSLGMPLKDAEFIETQKFGIGEIAKIYKIPPHKLGQLDRATFSNIEHQSIEYVKNTLQPIITNWEQEIDYKLFTSKERKQYYSKFNVESELRGDSQSRAQYYKDMVSISSITFNEIREKENQNGYGEIGDRPIIPLNMTWLDQLEELQKTKASKGGNKTDE
ncbi:phage portal protein [Brevibacillus laterosporus]|uniref:phage portal protein n=1 Tax=Brevibacillus laterosporus TaxID=1465 RepID=UPI001443E09D|nr:phage portal protein [Brevibacillus laterosporus]NKQ20507.1 phage portal protein [Brevibacillus laterosporus]WNX32593.1 phage portal protein [Brevibacillus laterosporus]